MIDLSSLGLDPGSAAEIVLPDGRAWHVQAGEDGCIWVSSPALPAPVGDDLERLARLKSVLESQAFAADRSGGRLVQLASGHLVVQRAWRGSVEPSAFWAQALAAESSWSAALTGSARALVPHYMGEAAEADTFAQLCRVVEQDAELWPVVTVNAEQRTVVIEPDNETWLVGLLCGPLPHEATLAMPLRALPSDTARASELIQQALAANAGITLGPDVFVGLDATDPDLETLLLVMRLEIQALQTDDLTAAVGRLLHMGGELLLSWTDSQEIESAPSGAVFPGHAPLFMNIKG